MHKLTRKAALEAIKSAGASNDHKALVRLYTENRISYAAANAAFVEGRRFARSIEVRDQAARLEASDLIMGCYDWSLDAPVA